VDELLQLLIAILNTFFENGDQLEMGLLPISSKTLMLTWQSRTLLKEEWSVFHKLLNKRHGKPLCLMVPIVGNFCLLTQFMSSQGPQLLLAISWILVSKNVLLVDLTICLNDFQSSRVLDSLYLLKDRLQSSFHHFLECLVMLAFLALENQACSSPDASELMICSSDSWFVIDEVLRNLNMEMTSLTNFSSSLLFLGIVSLEDWMNSSAMEMICYNLRLGSGCN